MKVAYDWNHLRLATLLIIFTKCDKFTEPKAFNLI